MARFNVIPLTAAGLVLLGLAACAIEPHYYSKPGYTDQSFAADKLDCYERAKRDVGSTLAIGSPLFIAGQQRRITEEQLAVIDACMEARGYAVSIGKPQ
jgi:hypothetical protein